MTRFTCLLMGIFLQQAGYAQLQKGVVLDAVTQHPIAFAEIANRRTKAVIRSDKQGNFSIQVRKGDTIFFSHNAYVFKTMVIGVINEPFHIYLAPLSRSLQEVDVLGEMATFKKDSTDKAIIYKKMNADVNRKIKVTLPAGQGITFHGLFSETARKVSGRGKRERRLMTTMQHEEKERFIALRYNINVVRKVTKLDSSAAHTFVLRHKMPYDFARAATDLEINIWIRERYKNWSKRP